MEKHKFIFLALISITLIYVLPSWAEISTTKLNESNAVERDGVLVNPLNRTGVKQINQLRCWQQGRLIVDEANVQPLTGKSSGFSSQTGTRLNSYDFGETFCLYTGD